MDFPKRLPTIFQAVRLLLNIVCSELHTIFHAVVCDISSGFSMLMHKYIPSVRLSTIFRAALAIIRFSEANIPRRLSTIFRAIYPSLNIPCKYANIFHENIPCEKVVHNIPSDSAIDKYSKAKRD